VPAATALIGRLPPRVSSARSKLTHMTPQQRSAKAPRSVPFLCESVVQDGPFLATRTIRKIAETLAFLAVWSPCQGWGRGFESLRPLQNQQENHRHENGHSGRFCLHVAKTLAGRLPTLGSRVRIRSPASDLQGTYAARFFSACVSLVSTWCPLVRRIRCTLPSLIVEGRRQGDYPGYFGGESCAVGSR
jgi:hypothetical protein